jgi:WD40 repeat protein/energy-coupling factor transporter ATP-binding protein EcfA2
MSVLEPPGAADTPPHFDVYFSYNSRDRALVEPIAARLKRAGLEPWLDRWALTPGGDWQRELGAGLDACVACAVFVGAHDIGAWELQEVTVAIDRAATQRGFRVFPVLLPGVDEPFDPNRLPHFLRARTWVDFRDPRHDRRALQHLINAVKGVPFGPEVAVVRGDEVAPYRGLRVFGEEDARFFFGRDREIQRLLEKLKSSPFLAVLGPSGSGKSSLVRAGLVPELRAGALAVDGEWHVSVLRPGAAPLTALAAQLVELRPVDGMQATLDALGRDPRTLHLSVELALADGSPGERVLVIVDQLEEVFTLCNDESQRRQLFANLMYATSQPGGRTVVVVTMRADFYPRCAAYPEFAQLMTAQQMLIGPIDSDGLRQAIEEPARRVGLELEAGLSDTILADVAAEPGALPLLEHALLELWERRRGELLTLEGYREAGGVHGALAQRADQIFDGLSRDQREIARRALLRLTQPGEGTEDTRRRATRRELATAEGDAAFEMVLGRLVDARMLTTGRDETGQDVVDVSHEALIRGWPRLRGWIDADRAGLLGHRRLTDAAHEWDTLGREPAAFYRGARLTIAREWAAEHAGDLSPLEAEFLSASDAAERKELAAAARSTRRLRGLAGAMTALTLIVVVLGMLALGARNDARRQATDASSLALASTATSLLSTRPDVSMLLALAAYRESPAVEERSSMLAAVETIRATGVRAILHGHTGPVNGVVFSRDGRTLVSASNDGTVRFWEVASRRPIGAPLAVGPTAVYALALSPNGRILATGSFGGAIDLWDVATRKSLGRLPSSDANPVESVAFSPDGSTLAAGRADGVVGLWGVASRRMLTSHSTGATNVVAAVAFSPDGLTVASGSGDGTVRLWGVASGRLLGSLPSAAGNTVYGVAFSPDGRILASAQLLGGVRLWNVLSRRLIGEPLTGGQSALSVAFSPNGQTLASGNSDHTVRLWNVQTRRSLGQPLTGDTDVVSSVAFSPDGRTLASGSWDDTVRLWAPTGGGGLGQPLGQPPADGLPVRGVAVSPDGSSVASAGADADVRLQNSATGRLLVPPLAGGAGALATVAFSPDGGTVASAGRGGSIQLWDARSGRQIGRLDGRAGAVSSVAFSPDGRTLASGAQNGTIWLWNVKTARSIGRLSVIGGGAVESVAFSPDGRTLAAGGADHEVRLWDLATRRLLAPVLVGHDNAVNSLAFSPDGRILASGSADTTIRFWDVATRRPIGQLLGHQSAVFSVAFSPDGQTLASASQDQTIRLWDVATRRPLGIALNAPAPVDAVAFSPDGRTLVSGGDDGAVRIWDDILWGRLAALQSQVCDLVSGGLTRSEWAQFASGVAYRQTCG